jgi:hypothetical protein
MSYTTGQTVLLPESTSKKRGHRTVILAVSSRDRSLASYPYSNDFRWVLPRPLKDITSIELLSGCVPVSLYNVSEHWNKFTFGEYLTKRTITLTPGQYTIDQLVSELQTELNKGSINTYTVSYSAISKKVSISSVGAAPFVFYFYSGDFVDTVDTYGSCITSINCPATLLGFDHLDYTGSSTTPIVAPHAADPNFCLGRLYLHVNVDNSIELNRVEVGAGKKGCFHIIYTDPTLRDGYYFLNKDTYLPVFYATPAPIARVAFLNISLRDEFFRPIYLGNLDYTLVFEITTLG